MSLLRASYEFDIRLAAPRDAAYAWATDYKNEDFEVMGIAGRRTVQRLSPELVLLTDRFSSDPFSSRPGARTVKRKLVHLFPAEWSWIAVHVSGPARHSMFLYRLHPDGRNSSILNFRGNQVEETGKTPTPSFVRRRAATLRREDSDLWRRLARAMARDLNGR